MALLVRLAVLAISVGHVVRGQCTVPISYFSSKGPVLFRDKEYMVPNALGYLKWDKGETITISCDDSTFKGTDKNKASMTCSTKETFSIVGIPDIRKLPREDVKELVCSPQPSGSLQKGEKCANNTGTTYQFGFKGLAGLGPKPVVPLISVCYDEATYSPIYAMHVLRGESIGKAPPGGRIAFRQEGIPDDVEPAVAFLKESSQARLSDLLGKKKAAQYTSKDYLARGHLSPNSDGIFPAWRRATFFYMNVVPQWQTVNNGNWVRVEAAVQDKAEALVRDLTIYTGAHDILTLDNVPITLEAKGIQVPKWTWKIVKDGAMDEAIAFVTSNNPFRTAKETICTDICQAHGWYKVEFANLAIGYTYCCSVSDLMKAVGTIPKEANAKNILKAK